VTPEVSALDADGSQRKPDIDAVPGGRATINEDALAAAGQSWDVTRSTTDAELPGDSTRSGTRSTRLDQTRKIRLVTLI